MGWALGGEALVSCAGGLILWDPETTEIYFYDGHGDEVLAVSKARLETRRCHFLDDERVLTVSSEGALTWSLSTFRMIKQTGFHDDRSSSAWASVETGTLSRDARLWAGDGLVVRVDTGEPYTPLRHRQAPDARRALPRGVARPPVGVHEPGEAALPLALGPQGVGEAAPLSTDKGAEGGPESSTPTSFSCARSSSTRPTSRQPTSPP